MKKIKVAPIGTCRIHTPLRRAALHYPFELDLRRNFGFVHSSAEVRQQLDLMLGGEPAPQSLWPYVYRPNVTEAILRGPVAAPDFYFFEISSRKHVTVDGHPIQINYLYRNLPEFFRLAPLAAEYWSLTKKEDFAARQAWLETLPAFKKLAAEKQALLSNICMNEMSDEEIAADMKALAARVGSNKCVFVTHVNAIAQGSKVILSRQKLIQSVTRLAATLKLRCFDPTEDMLAFGQPFAMERDGADSTHYTLPFSEHLGGYWVETFIQPQMKGVDPAELARANAERRTIGRLDAMLSQGQVAKVSGELHKLLRSGQGGDPAQRLLAKLSSQLGDFERVIATLQALSENSPLSDEDDSILMAALLAIGDHQQAWDIGRRLLAQEKEDDQLLANCAACAMALGLTQEAIDIWSMLRANDSENKAALIGLLQCYQADGRKAEALALADEILLLYPDDETALVARWGDAIADAEQHQFDELVKQSKYFGDETSLTLAKLADQHGKMRLAATLLAQKPHIFTKPEYADAKDMRARWEEMGKAALGDHDFAVAAQHLTAAARASETERDAIALHKELVSRFRQDVRAAYAARDFAKVMRLAEAGRPHHIGFSGYHRIVGKAAVQLGDFAAALPHLKAEAEQTHSPEALLYLARIASKAQDYTLAYRSYQAVVAHPAAKADDVAAAQKALTNRFGAALKQARHLAETGRYDAAWELIHLLAQSSDDAERLDKERSRILRLVRIDFKAIDAADAVARLAAAEQYLRLAPSDEAMRRMAAIAAMRSEQYALARDHWLALAAQGEMTPQIESALDKCTTLIARAERRKAA